jgi:hypothetical protein
MEITYYVIPGRCKASNSDVQWHIGESRDENLASQHLDSGSAPYGASRNDGVKNSREAKK